MSVYIVYVYYTYSDAELYLNSYRNEYYIPLVSVDVEIHHRSISFPQYYNQLFIYHILCVILKLISFEFVVVEPSIQFYDSVWVISKKDKNPTKLISSSKANGPERPICSQ